MKGKQQDISTIINDGETSLKCMPLYGPNSYLLNELYNKLCDSLLDKNDVFAPSEFNIKEISKNADAFYNEAESLAFGGGRKYLKIDMDNSESAGPVLDLLKDDIKETTLLIKGGVLSPRSNIRKSLEKLENTLIVPFYEDDIVSLKKFIKEKAEKRSEEGSAEKQVKRDADNAKRKEDRTDEKAEIRRARAAAAEEETEAAAGTAGSARRIAAPIKERPGKTIDKDKPIELCVLKHSTSSADILLRLCPSST